MEQQSLDHINHNAQLLLEKLPFLRWNPIENIDTQALSKEEFALITHEDSLSKLLKMRSDDFGVKSFQDSLHSHDYFHQSENNKLALSGSNLLREVVLGTKEEDWILARTVIPTTTIEYFRKEHDFSQQGTGLLGHFIFSKDTNRLEMHFAKVANLSSDNINADTPQLWVRRSLLEVDKQPLLIYECFLTPCIKSAMAII